MGQALVGGHRAGSKIKRSGNTFSKPLIAQAMDQTPHNCMRESLAQKADEAEWNQFVPAATSPTKDFWATTSPGNKTEVALGQEPGNKSVACLNIQCRFVPVR